MAPDLIMNEEEIGMTEKSESSATNSHKVSFLSNRYSFSKARQTQYQDLFTDRLQLDAFVNQSVNHFIDFERYSYMAI